MPSRRFSPEHLGSRLKVEYLDDYELSVEEFAAAIRVPLERVRRVLEGLDPVDADLALRLARLFGGSAEGWLSWENGCQLWHAHELIADELDTISPLDPETRLSVREDEPMTPELVEELKRRLDDVRDPQRWVVVSRIADRDVPLHEDSLYRMFYDVETGCYCSSLSAATAFKRRAVAEAVAAERGDGHAVVEVTLQDLERPRRDDAADRELRKRFFRSAGQGMSPWDIDAYLRGTPDMTAYLESAAEDGDPELIAAAVAHVMRAMTAQTTAEYLRERGDLDE